MIADIAKSKYFDVTKLWVLSLKGLYSSQYGFSSNPKSNKNQSTIAKWYNAVFVSHTFSLFLIFSCIFYCPDSPLLSLLLYSASVEVFYYNSNKHVQEEKSNQ